MVAVLNPFAVKKHMQSDLRRCKNDKSDAYSIAKFAAEKNSDCWTCPTDDEIKLKHLDAVVDGLQKQIRQSKNMLHSLTQVSLRDDLAVSIIKKTISSLEALMERARNKQLEMIESNKKEETALACSIPGIGLETSIKFFTHVGNINRFDSSRSLISWIGLTPRNAQSGTSIHKNGGISRMGCTRLRSQFYMCAVVAIKYNPDCRAFYHRLKELGKPSKVALIAVANKLLRQLYAVLTKKEAYVPNFCTKAS
jgi:transposase